MKDLNEYALDFRPEYWDAADPLMPLLQALPATEFEGPENLEYLEEQCRNGAYKPAYLPGEIEIAQIDMSSVLMDEVSIRACRWGGRIHYRVVDEYEGEFKCCPNSSVEPLTFGEMIAFMDAIETPYTKAGQTYIIVADW